MGILYIYVGINILNPVSTIKFDLGVDSNSIKLNLQISPMNRKFGLTWFDTIPIMNCTS
jgi:hypothetical protein